MSALDHIALRVADLDRSLAFYTELLPARLVSRVQHEDRWRTEIATLRTLDETAPLTLVLLMPRRVRLLLWLFHHVVPRQTRSHEHLGFRCDSLAELRERFERARAIGATIENPLTEVSGRGAHLFEVLDPDRNGVEWLCGRVHD